VAVRGGLSSRWCSVLAGGSVTRLELRCPAMAEGRRDPSEAMTRRAHLSGVGERERRRWARLSVAAHGREEVRHCGRAGPGPAAPLLLRAMCCTGGEKGRAGWTGFEVPSLVWPKGSNRTSRRNGMPGRVHVLAGTVLPRLFW
jgi:hypothetical protein